MTRVVMLVLLAPLAVLAQPKGGTVVSGTATFQTQGAPLRVTNAPGAIINWSSFSISKEAAPNYIIQSPSAIQLNRVQQNGLTAPITGVLTTAPAMPMMPTTPVQLQAPVVAPASARQAVQLPDGRILFRTTPQ